MKRVFAKLRKSSAGILVKIERAEGGLYHITLKAGQNQLHPEIDLVEMGHPKWFTLLGPHE